jgi:hypothetical protein
MSELDENGRTASQRAAFEAQQKRNASIGKLHASLKGRKDTRGIGDFAKRPD